MADPKPPDPWESVKEMGTGLARASSAQGDKSSSDANAQRPGIEYDPDTKQRFYDTAPVPTKRLLGSPLAPTGPFSIGKQRERSLVRGWDSGHRSLDFNAVSGEPVFAMADGTVVFVGFQSKTIGLVNLESAHADSKGNIYGGGSDAVATPRDVGEGGIIIQILHSGDFEGYRTEYFRLDSVSVSAIAPGNQVTEGQQIGKAGGTGGPAGFSKKNPVLPIQVSFVSGPIVTIVRPTAFVPNAWPGHQDSTSGTGLGSSIVMPILNAFGAQTMASDAAVIIQSLDRATSLQNQDTSATKLAQSRHDTFIQQTLNNRQSTLYAATAAFKEQPFSKVTAPMVFDFEKGVWVVGGIEQGPL